MYPKKINDLIEAFKLLPGIGKRTAERLSFSLIEMDKNNVDFMVKSMQEAINGIHRCNVCNNYTDDEVCPICSDSERNKEIICIVDDPKNVFLFERLNSYKGYYFVLFGLISPIDGIGPDDIGVNKLIERINGHDFKEVLIAVKPSIEGETTSLYIKKILENYGIKVTKIASGVPMGADIEYIDSLTLQKAIEDRREV